MFTNNYYASLVQADYRQQELLREAAHDRLVATLRRGSNGNSNQSARGLFHRAVVGTVTLLRHPARSQAEFCCTAG